MSYALLRQLLFLLPPEVAHEVSLHSLKLLCRGPIASALRARVPLSPVEVMGLHFPSRVGLAAGLDKNAEYIDALGALGFGFIEVGTVTPRPQPGNPAPRLFRLPAAEALINRMGFNNQGVEYFLEQVCQARREGFLLGLNIGKNFDTPVENALDDYLTGLRAVYPHADYVTVNISSPNTQGLRSLQHGAALDALLAGLTQEQARLTQAHGRHVPLAIKVAPDLSDEEIIDVADALRRHRIDALIATNTTLSREGVEGLPHAEETGGLSGRPVFARSTRVLEKFGQALAGELPMIAAGGIMSGEDAAAKIKAGASLVQIYTGFIYRGPGLIREIAQRLK
ncbi:MAG: quinone-dependent dihydroorotate dehydrogenase [Halothiobacillaceae bacterium]|jgi:dihydroorotate dehydrogenase|nr:quinone-dependent dihydroorotate dehydrogenase [Halothiobacillaceae bacterium]